MQRQNKLSPPQKSIETNSICSQFQLECSEFENISEVYVLNSEKINSSPKKRSGENVNKDQNSRKWSSEDQTQLMDLHKKMGNKWTLLTQYYPGTSQNFIKNHFYSRLRKSIRKLNKIISSFYQKQYNKFKLNIIFKLSNISEGKISEKHKITPQIFAFYRDILYTLIQFSQSQKVETKCLSLTQVQSVEVQSFVLALIALQNLFKLVRGQRTAKGKKKNIAYLRQFSFKLGLHNPNKMVITKQSIYLQNGQNAGLQPQFLHSKNSPSQPQNLQLNHKQSYATLFTSQSFVFKTTDKDDHSQKIVEEFQNLKQHSLQLQRDNQSQGRSQIWRDYLGFQMRQYDVCDANQPIHEQLNQFQLFFQNKNFDFSQGNNMW